MLQRWTGYGGYIPPSIANKLELIHNDHNLDDPPDIPAPVYSTKRVDMYSKRGDFFYRSPAAYRNNILFYYLIIILLLFYKNKRFSKQ